MKWRKTATMKVTMVTIIMTLGPSSNSQTSNIFLPHHSPHYPISATSMSRDPQETKYQETALGVARHSFTSHLASSYPWQR